MAAICAFVSNNCGAMQGGEKSPCCKRLFKHILTMRINYPWLSFQSSFTHQTFKRPFPSALFTVGMLYFKEQKGCLSNGPHVGSHPFASRDPGAVAVSLHSSNIKIATGLHLFLAIRSLYCVTRIP